MNLVVYVVAAFLGFVAVAVLGDVTWLRIVCIAGAIFCVGFLVWLRTRARERTL